MHSRSSRRTCSSRNLQPSTRNRRTNMSREVQQPSYRAYTVIKRDGQDDFWQALGAAFPHQDGKGFNIVLQALPIDGKIVLREPQEDDRDQPADTAKGNVTNVRGYKDRRADQRERSG